MEETCKQKNNKVLPITHALVRYTDDEVVTTVLISEIKKFKPQHLDDFVPSKRYLVFWPSTLDCSAKDAVVPKEKKGFYGAIILALGGIR